MTKTQRRRRNEAKTDYKSRFRLLKSSNPRMVVRKSNRYILVQIVLSEIAQDKIFARVSSKELLEKGWPKEKTGSLKSRAAAYLAGFLLAKRLKGEINECILDIGLNRNVSGSRTYAALKGALDGGLKISCNPEALPSDEMISSDERIRDLIKKIKDKIQ